jgi:RNA-directed DNA polymerase
VALEVDLGSVGEAGSSARRGDFALLSNLYLNEVDQMLERAKAVTQHERWTAVEYARFRR